MKAATFKLPLDLHRKFKSRCVADDITMTSVIEKLMRDYLAKKREFAKAKERS
jgi:hypothetical protein